ncbi:SdpA family antimicrobial peptide system protein [Microbacterium sp.]|uniref:SdpA family antimicrobial peptide system protein n=1 Tax=Microbacterium sp. TaxID=51671 RepID=UPI0025D209CC|nr:SdpA family antimicrobial peptide system protein [Microbacterium sp.]MBT9607823.1 SdpA family antimicrobial peptide system protein [Microbacterium sp.]
MTPTTQGRDRRSAASHVGAVAALVTVLLVGCTVTWLPIGELLPTTLQSQVRAAQPLAPQGWAFFTKSPRGPVASPYRSEDGEWTPADRGPNAQFRWAFGLNRESRLTEFDVQTALAEVDDSWWQDCPRQSDDAQCLTDAVPRAVASVGHDLRLCGEVGIVRREPVPWAYREFVDRSAGQAIRLTVSCEEIR